MHIPSPWPFTAKMCAGDDGCIGDVLEMAKGKNKRQMAQMGYVSALLSSAASKPHLANDALAAVGYIAKNGEGAGLVADEAGTLLGIAPKDGALDVLANATGTAQARKRLKDSGALRELYLALADDSQWGEAQVSLIPRPSALNPKPRVSKSLDPEPHTLNYRSQQSRPCTVSVAPRTGTTSSQRLGPLPGSSRARGEMSVTKMLAFVA